MIRVLHFIPGYYIGGIESLIMSLYENIDKTRMQFDFLVETQEWLEDFEKITKNGGNVYQIKPLNKKNPLLYIKEIKEFFKRKNKIYSVVHCHNIERSLFVLYYAKKYKVICRIFHSHTDSIEDYRYEKITKFIIRLNNRLSTHYFACSTAAGDFYFKKDKKPFFILKNAIDTNTFTFSAEKRRAFRSSLNLENYFVIGHTGRFTYQKNHWKIVDIFYEVYKKYPHSRLLLVGEGPTKQEIEEKVDKLGLSHAVIFTGSRSDIANLLLCMDIFLLPSFFEGFCISLLEAQSMGLPCISSTVIPSEVQITDLITKINLNESNEKWAESILSYQNHHRTSQDSIIKKKGYDTYKNAKWLMDFYLNQT